MPQLFQFSEVIKTSSHFVTLSCITNVSVRKMVQMVADEREEAFAKEAYVHSSSRSLMGSGSDLVMFNRLKRSCKSK